MESSFFGKLVLEKVEHDKLGRRDAFVTSNLEQDIEDLTK